MQCHLETTTDPLPHAIRRVGRGYFSYSPAERLAEYALHFDHAPGRGYDAKFEVVNAVYRLRQSSCFLRSEAMTCTSCHDPHHAERGETASRRYDAICQKCHDPKSASGDPHLVRAGCTDCHMPKRVADDAPHVRMTDHRIGIPEFDARPRNAKAAAYRGPVELYYPEKIDNGEERELYMALAQVRGFTNLDEGLPRLTSAVRRVNPPQPDFEYFLGEGYRRQGALQSAAAAYRRSLGTDPAFWPAALGLGLALANSGDLTGAIATLEPHRTADVSAAVALGDFYYRSGRWVDARETLLSALEMDPDSPEAHNNLAAVYAAQQRLAGAEAEAREAIRNRPDYAAAHANLGAILLAAGRPTEAVASYDQALALGAEAGAVEAGRKRALDVLGGGQP